MSAKKGLSQANPRSIPYKVFISSTYLDNQERRKIVQDAIAMARMLWHGMERFTASTRPTVEECLRYVREADLLVGIIAWRYGWEPEGKKSITEMEYDAATERLMFQLDPSLPVIPDKDYDPGPDRWEKQKKLKAFKRQFSKDQMSAAPFTETTLGAKVLAALIQWRERKEGPAPPKPSRLPTKPSPPSGRDPEEEIASYRQKAVALHATLPVAGFVTRIQVPIDLEEIYVPLRAMIDLRGLAAEKAQTLINRLREPDFRARRVFELTRNPLLLANICLVHRHRGSLPQKKGPPLRGMHRCAAGALAGGQGVESRGECPGRPPRAATGGAMAP